MAFQTPVQSRGEFTIDGQQTLGEDNEDGIVLEDEVYLHAQSSPYATLSQLFELL